MTIALGARAGEDRLRHVMVDAAFTRSGGVAASGGAVNIAGEIGL